MKATARKLDGTEIKVEKSFGGRTETRYQSVMDSTGSNAALAITALEYRSHAFR